jgi:acetylornithine deacetylase/succinyl-diaminopimelate desuccinylase family protein
MNEIDLTQELVRINSENPPGNESQVAKFIKDFLEDLGFSTEIVDFDTNRSNVIASIGSGEGLMFNGHMDTVPIGDLKNWNYDPLGGKIVNGKIYGRGTSDMKGGIAAILAAVKNLSNEKIKRKLLLTFVADEEVALRGSKYLIANRKDIFKDVKYGVVAECDDLNLTIAQKGITDIKIKFKGKAAHGSRPELGDNAIYKAVDFIQELRKLMEKLKIRKNPILGSGTINVGLIKGGTKVNVVPDYCEIEVDRRLIPNETPSLAIKQIRNLLKKLKLKADVEVGVNRLPMQFDGKLEIIRIIRSISKVRTIGSSGYDETELYYRDAKVPCVTFGPGIMNQAHVADEFIPIKNLQKATKIYEELIKRVCL